MATIKLNECPVCYTTGSNGGCVPINTPACNDYFKKNPNAVKRTTFQEIAANYAVANDRLQVEKLLVDNGTIANLEIAHAMSDKQLVSTLYGYYLKNGATAYALLLAKFVPNRNANNWTTDQARLTPAVEDLRRLKYISSNPNARADWFTELWTGLVGSSSTTQPTTVITTTSTSPAVIGYILAGVLVLAVLAYVIVKK